MLKRSLFREIRKSLGRYLAIFAIIALGVGFFAGLSVSEDAMIKTADQYVTEYSLYDYRLISTLGFQEEDVAAVAAADGVSRAEGSVFSDVVCLKENGSEYVVKVHTLMDGINIPKLTSGRMPEAPNECVADRRYYSEADIGKTIVLSESNDEDTLDLFAYDEYVIVGTANSVYYMNYERGSTSMGNGTVSAFLYIPYEGLDCDYYSEIFLKLEDTGYLYSDEYYDAADAERDSLTVLAEDRACVKQTRR